MENLNEMYIIIIKIIFSVICMVWVNYDFIRRVEEFWISIKGNDKILQITEACMYVWIRLLPIIVLGELFFNFTLSSQAWYSLDAIFFMLIAGDLGHTHLKLKKDEQANKKGTS